MARNKMVLSICLLCIVLLTGCLQSTKYPKYEMEKRDNGQYILTSPDGIAYVTLENSTWFPEEYYTTYDYNEAIGRCDAGYVFVTDSETCLFTDDFRGSIGYTFFLDGIVLPELSIDNINNAVLKETHDRDLPIIVNDTSAEKFIELYNNTEIHEIKDIHKMRKTWELVIKCKQYEDLVFSRPIYTFDNDYYLYIIYEYDSEEDKSTSILCKCTSLIKNILEKS